MRLETEVEHYLCEQCDPRPVDRVCLSLLQIYLFDISFFVPVLLLPSYAACVVVTTGSSHDPPAQLCSGWLHLLHMSP